MHSTLHFLSVGYLHQTHCFVITITHFFILILWWMQAGVVANLGQEWAPIQLFRRCLYGGLRLCPLVRVSLWTLRKPLRWPLWWWYSLHTSRSLWSGSCIFRCEKIWWIESITYDIFCTECNLQSMWEALFAEQYLGCAQKPQINRFLTITLINF